jgi:ABC-2 type transport system permease protein
MSPMRLDFLQNQIAFFNLGLAGFVLAAISSRFVFTAVSAEGEAYWLIRSSPISVKDYIRAKFLFFLIPMLLLGEILILATNYLLDVTGFMMLLSSATMFVMVFGIIALGIGFGAMYPRFRYENISQLSTGYGGVMFMILSAIYIVLIVVLEAGPVYIFFMADLRGRAITGLQWLFIVISFSAVMAINLFAVIKPLRMGIRSLIEYE